MVNSREILLKLVRLAMGWEWDYTFPEDVNWAEVLDMATEQGVSAIIVDGYENLTQKNREIKGGLSAPENKELLLQAIGQVPMIEATYKQHYDALKELGSILSKADVQFLLMKGFACGQYYPKPYHRACGDIDIYPGNYFEQSNDALKTAGAEINPYYYRHSASVVNGVMVENHKILCDLRGPKKQTQLLERQLEEEGKRSIVEGREVEIFGTTIKGARYPTANFNALFLPWHVSAHFMFERVTVRHLLDWALFLTHEGKDIDVEMFRKAKKKYTYGYSKFADILTALALNYFRIPEKDLPQSILDDANKCDSILVEKVFNYMFVGQPRERDENVWKFRWNNVRRVWKERWKYQEIYNVSTFGFFFYKIWGVIFKVGVHE